MSKSNIEQKLIRYFSWFFTGVTLLGGFFGVLNDTLEIVTPPLAIAGTITILTIWFGVQGYLKKRGGVDWKTTQGERITIRKLNFGYALPLIGMLFLLWYPTATSLFRKKEQRSRSFSVVAVFHIIQTTYFPLGTAVY